MSISVLLLIKSWFKIYWMTFYRKLASRPDYGLRVYPPEPRVIAIGRPK